MGFSLALAPGGSAVRVLPLATPPPTKGGARARRHVPARAQGRRAPRKAAAAGLPRSEPDRRWEEISLVRAATKSSRGETGDAGAWAWLASRAGRAADLPSPRPTTGAAGALAPDACEARRGTGAFGFTESRRSIFRRRGLTITSRLVSHRGKGISHLPLLSLSPACCIQAYSYHRTCITTAWQRWLPEIQDATYNLW